MNKDRSTTITNSQLKEGYKQTEVGIIPEDWEVGTLDKYWSVIDCKHVTAKFIRSGIPVASIREVQSRFVNLDSANQTTETYYKQLIEGGRRPQNGDLILSRNATVGEIAQVADWHPSFAMGQDVCLLRKRSTNFSTALLQTVIQSWIVLQQLENCMVGSTFRRVNVEQIKNLTIPLPPTKVEQEAIACTLSDIDALIESLDRLLTKKRQIKQGAMQELLRSKDGWEKKRIGDVLTISHGRSQHEVVDENGDYPILASGGQIGRATTYLYNKPSVLIGRKGTIDKPQYMDRPFWTVDTLFYSIIHEPNNAKYLFYQFCLIPWREYSEASGVPSLNARTIEGIEITVPSPKEQIEIANILSDMDAEIGSIESKLVKTRQLKQGMMHELLTGRIRLVD
jgi:type I restriction enzyme, S subunit